MQPSTLLFVRHVSETGNRGPLKTPKVAINDETKCKWTMYNFHKSRAERLCERLWPLETSARWGSRCGDSDYVLKWSCQTNPQFCVQFRYRKDFCV